MEIKLSDKQITIKEFFELIVETDNTLDRGGHAHTGEYREGWDDCILALLEKLKNKESKNK